jgi:hypothetical protein
MRLLLVAAVYAIPVLAQAAPNRPREQANFVIVPFVGCKSEGQVGPRGAPKGDARRVAIPVEATKRLAYYQAENGGGVLAPRGWNCFGTYGSNGSNLYVSPDPISSQDLFSSKWRGFGGAAIQISEISGETSGRFGVAQIIARVFPTHMEFVRNVIAEGIEPASSFPSGPYPQDQLKYISREVVEFTTPANAEGLGTHSHLLAGSDPVKGVVLLDPEESGLTQLCVRMPKDMIDLVPVVTKQLERESWK